MFNEDGYLFNNNKENHYISDDDINRLISFFDTKEKAWQEDINSKARSRYFDDFILDEMLLLNTKGTIVKYPFGKRALTFTSSRHFFRGENQIYPYSLPSLDRTIMDKNDQEKELYHALSCLRIERFTNFLWEFNSIPFWCTKSDINYKALAQHYGFKTHLMDLTNDFKVALFFATSKYDSSKDAYVPLTDEDISKDYKYGVIYHTPNYTINYPFGMAMSDLFFKYGLLDREYEIDSGVFDGVAFQIGYQPFLRCEMQNGYVMSLRNGRPLNENSYFEKIYFKQSLKLSKKVYDMMDKGKKVFPNEGINKAKKWLDEIKKTFKFTTADLDRVYDVDINKDIFKSKDEFKKELLSFSFDDNKIKLVDCINYDIPNHIKNTINESVNADKLFAKIDNNIFYKSDDLKHFNDMHNILYGDKKESNYEE